MFSPPSRRLLACDDGTALLYEGDQLVRAVAVNAKARAYRVRRDGDKVVEEALKMEYLGVVK